MSEVSAAPRSGTPSWVDLMTTDREAAMRFYAGLFGWEFEVGPPEIGHYTMCKLRGHQIAGIGGQPPPDAGAPQFPVAWTTYLAVDDTDAICGRATAAGGQLLMGPVDIMDEGRMAVLADSSGAVFGVWQAGKHYGAQLVNEPGTLIWNEVNVRDTDAAKRFYSEVFGHELVTLEGPPDVGYTMLKINGHEVGGILGMAADWPEDSPAHWMTYFGVTDTDATAARIPELGGSVEHGPFDTTYGRVAVIKDPQGAHFAIIEVTEAVSST